MAWQSRGLRGDRLRPAAKSFLRRIACVDRRRKNNSRSHDRAALGRGYADSPFFVDAVQRLAHRDHLVCAVYKQDNLLEGKKVHFGIRLTLAAV